MHFIGFMLSIGGLIFTNVFNIELITGAFTYVLIGLGVACALVSIVFAISMQCYMKNRNSGFRVNSSPNSVNSMENINNNS